MTYEDGIRGVREKHRISTGTLDTVLDLIIEHHADGSDLEVRLFNGSTVRLFGADNPNALEQSR
jgi:hypothetical protein